MFFRILILKFSSYKWVEAFIRKSKFARPLIQRFTGGDTLEDGIRNARELLDRGFLISLDLLGESVHSESEANKARDAFMEIIEEIVKEPKFEALEFDNGDPKKISQIETLNISIKLTQCGLDISEELAVQNFRKVLALAKEKKTFVRVDMEASAYTEQTLAIIESVFEDFPNSGTVLQSYLFRTEADLDRMNQLGCRLRLVKGAYLESKEIAFESKAEVDAAYIKLAQKMLLETNYPAFATQDEKMVVAIKDFAVANSIPKDKFEFQMLFGIRRDLQESLLAEGYNVRIYVPFGDSWYPYFSRRLAERPANVWFILRAMLKG